MNESSSKQFQLCFHSLFHSGRSYAFPCSADGQVNMDRLSDRARNNYLYARAMVGRELSAPAIEKVIAHRAQISAVALIAKQAPSSTAHS